MPSQLLRVAVLLLLLLAGCQGSGWRPWPGARPETRGYRPSTLPGTILPDPGLRHLPPVSSPPPVAVTDRIHQPPWKVELAEVMTVAMANSNIVRTVQNGTVEPSEATGYDTAIGRARVDAAMAAFDASLAATYFWNQINQPPDSFFGPGIPEPNRRDESALNLAIIKPWATGAETRVAYNPPVGYLWLPGGSSGLFNPTHESNIEISVRQPLLRGAGWEFNTAAITVAQLRADQSAWDFKRALLEFVRDVHVAYWQLHAAQVARETVAQQVRLTEEVVRIEEAAMAAQRAVRADVAKARTQLAGFRQRQVAAESTLVERELRLRNLVGLPPDREGLLVAATVPSQARFIRDPACETQAALDHRPDLIRQRLAIRLRETEVLIARNGYRPQFDVGALYRTTGVAQQLDRSLSMMAENDYVDWQFGATFSVPLGRRAGEATVRAAQLQLQRENALLQAQLHKTAHDLADVLREIEYTYREYEQAEERVRESGVWLQGARIRYKDPPPAGEGRNWLLLALDDYLMAMRAVAEATTDAADLLARYNGQSARLEEVKGTLLLVSGIEVAGDPCWELTAGRPGGRRKADSPLFTPEPATMVQRLPPTTRR